MSLKWCRTGQHKVPVEQFGPDKRARDGLRSCCRPCEAEQAKNRYQNLPPEKQAARVAQVREWEERRRKERLREFRRARRQKAREAKATAGKASNHADMDRGVG